MSDLELFGQLFGYCCSCILKESLETAERFAARLAIIGYFDCPCVCHDCDDNYQSISKDLRTATTKSTQTD